jgi:hypothetical protein
MTRVCTDPQRLAALCAALEGGSLEERRSELLGRYLEARVEAGIAAGIEQHVAACSGCREALEDERLLAGFKNQTRLVLASCPSHEEMLQYLERDASLSPFRRLEIKTHFQKCSLCRDEAAWAQKTVAAPAAEPAPEKARAPWWSWGWAWGAAAAAAVVLAVLLLYPYQFGSRRFARYAQVPDFSYDQILAEFGENHPEDLPRFRQAALEISLGGYQEGATILKELQSRHGSDPSIAFFQGYIALREGRWQEATLLCTKAESSALDGFRCWYLANVALKAGDLRLARRELRHAAGHQEYRERSQRLLQMMD